MGGGGGGEAVHREQRRGQRARVQRGPQLLTDEGAAEGFSLLQGGGPGDLATLHYDAGTNALESPNTCPLPAAPDA